MEITADTVMVLNISSVAEKKKSAMMKKTNDDQQAEDRIKLHALQKSEFIDQLTPTRTKVGNLNNIDVAN